MPLAAELSLPVVDPTDPALRGRGYREAMASLEPHEGWLAAQPFGFAVLDRESGEFFLRTRAAEFPGRMIAQLFGIDSGLLHEEIVRNIITLSGADHARLRQLVNPALAPRRVDRYRPAMREFLAGLLTELPADGRCEFVSDFAKPYPSQVIAHVMGAPIEDAGRLHYFSNWIQRQFDAGSLTTEREQIEQVVADCYAYIDALIEARRDDPREDLITDLIAAEAREPDDVRAAHSGEAGRRAGGWRTRLSPDELRNLVLNILVGGVDTSQSQLAHTVRLLAEAPEQWERLRSDPDGLALKAVEEAIRYEPITPFTARITTEQVEHRGVTFPAGSIVLISAWHANRDDVEDDDFDIESERSAARVLTFGAGIHYCVGANLARAELEEAIVFLARHLRSVELAGEPEFGTPAGIYGLESLPLRLELA